jgi:hypothetical protein
MPEAVDPAIVDDGSETGDAEGTVARVAAHLAGLDLDVQTLELIMAALTADVCDQVDISPR